MLGGASRRSSRAELVAKGKLKRKLAVGAVRVAAVRAMKAVVKWYNGGGGDYDGIDDAGVDDDNEGGVGNNENNASDNGNLEVTLMRVRINVKSKLNSMNRQTGR